MSSTETYATTTGSNGGARNGAAAGAVSSAATSSTVATNGATGTRRPGSVPSPGRPATGPRAWSASAPSTEPYSPPRIAAPPEPRLRQLIGVCGWAAVLGGIGLVVGVRGFFGILAGDPPGWYETVMMILGAVGIGLTMTGYLTVHQRRTPWISLGAASLVLIASMVATSLAF